jgi:hypothetical protein
MNTGSSMSPKFSTAITNLKNLDRDYPLSPYYDQEEEE